MNVPQAPQPVVALKGKKQYNFHFIVSLLLFMVSKLLSFKFVEPIHFLIAAFFFVIMLGTGLLLLPVSQTPESSLSFIDALFTATSATTVTGLMVLGIEDHFSLFGKCVLLLLMQIGGLGIMTFSTMIIALLRKEVSFKEKWLVQDSFSSAHSMNLKELLKKVLLLSVGVEAIGFILLFISFEGSMPVSDALFSSLFHAVSGFCNAGLTLFPDSLMSFRHDTYINLVFAFLIIVGSLGFLVIVELGDRYKMTKEKRPRQNLSFHTKVILVFSGSLILIGTLMLMMIEQNHTLAGENFFSQLLISFFQTVTKTAGFVTVDFDDMSESSLLMYLFFMFVGAAPGSVGGGIKITTFAVLCALAISRFRNEERVFLMRHTVDEETVSKTISIVIISCILIGLFFMLLLNTETLLLDNEESDRMFVVLLFETISAFGTVGLSLGATAELSDAGKLLVILLMFIGRLGPLTLAIAISLKEKKRHFLYSEEKLMVG